MNDLFALLFVILFWGFETGNIVFSAILSLFFSLSFYIKKETIFSFTLFKFASLISYFLFFIVIYYYLNNDVTYFLNGILKWSPLITLPLITLELYSFDKKIPIYSLLIFSNNKDKKIKILYYYIFITVLGTSTGEINLFFYIFIAVFFAVFLFYLKPKRYSFILWIFSFMFLMILSFIMQNNFVNLHKKLVEKIVDFMTGVESSDINILKSNTRIGSIGKLKLSNKIVYRMIAPLDNYPLYLREASYTKYFDGDWIAPKSKFSEFNGIICPHDDKKVLTARLFGDFKENYVLPLVTRVNKVIKKNDEVLMKNNLMVIKRKGVSSNMVSFKYYEDNFSCADEKVSYEDFKIPKNEEIYIKLFIKKAHLNSRTPVYEVLKKIKYIFNNEYWYSLNIDRGCKSKSALGSFLIDNKSGHCEYFATATTLILRELGIPARYTVGYSVQEYNEFENNFIIRQRHAHAWVRVFIGNRWYNFDTTPSRWVEEERKMFSGYYKISDFLSYLEYKFKSSSFWRFIVNNYQYSLIFLILFFILIKVKNRKKQKNKSIIIKRNSKIFKKIDKVLKKKGIIRKREIPFNIWLDNLNTDDKNLINYNKLSEIIGLYYIIRFSKQEMPRNSLKKINKKIKEWKKQL